MEIYTQEIKNPILKFFQGEEGKLERRRLKEQLKLKGYIVETGRYYVEELRHNNHASTIYWLRAHQGLKHKVEKGECNERRKRMPPSCAWLSAK